MKKQLSIKATKKLLKVKKVKREVPKYGNIQDR